ncbi:hypothetical protein BBJ28_00005811 [Nothophytophthora sp. Chile5]|nr:hypothetical protein BBJ28_00005811 [Nothophytophthora sp. Chile5]
MTTLFPISVVYTPLFAVVREHHSHRTMSMATSDGAEDANARLGVHVEDLSAERPPNPFLFPRSFLRSHLLHDTVGIHPFLPAYPPQILQNLQPNPILESCAGKFFLSAAMDGWFCATEKARARHDVGNELVAGCATGAALAAGQGYQAQCLGCAGFAAFSYAINYFTDGKF